MGFTIRVTNLSKQYCRGLTHAGSIRELVNGAVDRLRGRRSDVLPHEANGDGASFWALRDVSFDVQPAEVLGVIGGNGAGKSTLLKVLSRITAPTEGRIEINGRVASLLEVGTGFHPELTGRENVFLNGAILGMTKAEIRRKFDEIVAFSEIGDFIDTPVKRYSSGMYVRLAFAVAAHLEPEILIVDEVLAVGDASFQKKCIGKMQNVSKGGRTVLFVSHNMQAVAALCGTVLWLQEGRLLEAGASRNLVAKYIQKHAAEGLNDNLPLADKPRSGSGAARFTKLMIASVGSSSESSDHFVTGSSVQIDVEIRAERQLRNANVAVTIYDDNYYRLIDVNTAVKGEFLSMSPGVKAKVRFVIEELLLKPGRYIVELWLGRGGIEDVDFVKGAGLIEVHDDIEKVKHTEAFPGTYQCRFTSDLQIFQ
jgi:lipopolysaccharide transport system ATP-binding protein